MARTWTCRRKVDGRVCDLRWPRTKQKCSCGGVRPAARRPKHQLVLETPYELWVARFGERCGICGRHPGPSRRLDRDHSHATGLPRGLLCHRCNRALPNWMTAEWLRRALAYVEREMEAFDSADSAASIGPVPLILSEP